jgi:hypothetical protein
MPARTQQIAAARDGALDQRGVDALDGDPAGPCAR